MPVLSVVSDSQPQGYGMPWMLWVLVARRSLSWLMQPTPLFLVWVCGVLRPSHWKFQSGFALTCLLVGILCLFGGPIANRIGLRWTLMLGAVGYPLYSYVSQERMWNIVILELTSIYSAALYTNNRFVSSTLIRTTCTAQGWRLILYREMCGLYWLDRYFVVYREYPISTKWNKSMD